MTSGEPINQKDYLVQFDLALRCITSKFSFILPRFSHG